jgi:hypothetical protein
LALVSYWPHGRSDAHVVDHKGALLQWGSCFATFSLHQEKDDDL